MMEEAVPTPGIGVSNRPIGKDHRFRRTFWGRLGRLGCIPLVPPLRCLPAFLAHLNPIIHHDLRSALLAADAVLRLPMMLSKCLRRDVPSSALGKPTMVPLAMGVPSLA